ncbi:MAG: HlyD family type I secretion periplasmic adaptor subunit [Rhodobacterales bacterium]
MTKTTSNEWSAKGPLLIGFASLAFLVIGIGLWSATTKIAGAVIASGIVRVEANRQVIQHPNGGVVGKINVKNGDIVKAGDVLLRFDDSQLKSKLAIIEGQYFELLARKALFKAERDGRDSLSYAPELIARAKTDEMIRDLMHGQKTLFDARRKSLENQQQQLHEQTVQMGRQIDGVNAQIAASKTQLELLGQELKNAQSLLDKGLAQASRVLALRREQARIAGQIGNLTASLGRLEAAISEINIKVVQLETGQREKAIQSLRDIEYRSLDLSGKRTSILQTLKHLDVRAPMAGTVYGNKVFALQSVIQAAQPMMYIIPKNQPLVVQARISTKHVDQVFVGQNATLSFATFSQRTTPRIFGAVTKLSADVFTDKATGANYYQVELKPKPGEMAKLGHAKLLPGMPVEAFLQTGERSTFSYLVKPVTDYFNKAFREK